MSTGRESHAYVMPGNHEFAVSYLIANTYSTPVTLSAHTKAGHTYVFRYQLHDKEEVSFSVEDKGQNYDPLCLIPKPGAKGGTEGKDC